MARKIEELRDHLFDTLEALKDKNNPMEIERAKAIADVAQVLINTVKVEVEAMRVTGSTAGTGFLPEKTKTIEGLRSPEQRSTEQRQLQRDRA